MNIPIWPGSSSFTPGKTPFGYYDLDFNFQSDADKVADWCAKRLGYPIMDVELQDVNFYAALEESITEFTTQVNMNNASDYMHTLIGASNTTDLNGRVISANLGRTVQLAKEYGSEAGSGGTIDWKKGYIDLIPNQSVYDLDTLWSDINESGSRIEVKRVFHDFSPAIVRYFDPYVGTGAGTQQLLDSFGWGSYSPAVSFMVMPLYADLLRIQAIEMNDKIRKSNYSFEIRNNQLKIFPIPTFPVKVWFEYIVESDRIAQTGASGNVVTDLSNIPFNRNQYSSIKDIGVQWIYKFALATAKEMLGLIRSKYSTIPVPGSELTLNGTDLMAQGREDKTSLLTELTTILLAMGRKTQLENEAAMAVSLQQQLSKVPLPIYIK